MRPRAAYQNHLFLAHRCYNVVLRCIDFRFRPHLDALLAQLFADQSGFGDYDEIAVAGGPQALTTSRATSILEDLGVAIRRHQAKQVILVAHRDCAAIGGSRAFARAQLEKEAQIAILRQARDLILESFPELQTVILLFQDKDELVVIVDDPEVMD